MIRKIITNTLASYALKLVQLILYTVSVPIIIRGVGNEGFGLIVFASTLIGYFNILDLGISQGVTKYVSQYMASGNTSQVNKIINTSLGLFIAIGLFVCGLIIFGIEYEILKYFNISDDNYDEARQLFIVAAFMAVFSWPRLVIEGTFRGIQDFVSLNLTIGTGRVISTLLAIIATEYFQLSMLYIFIAFNIDKFILIFWQYWLLRKKLPFWNFRLSDMKKSTLVMIFSFSGWVMLSQVAVLLEYQADQLIVTTFVSMESIAVYTIIFYLFYLIQQVSGMAASAVMPAVSEIDERRGVEGVRPFIYKGVKYHNLLFVPLVVVVYYLAIPFINLWVGAQYEEYIWLIEWMILFQLVWQSNALLGQIYYGVGKSKKPGIIAIFTGILNITLSLVLVQYYGVIGVIIGTIIAGLVAVPIAVWLLLSDLNIDYRSYIMGTIFKAQYPFWIVFILLYPFQKYFLFVDTWTEFFGIGIIFSLILYIVGFYLVLDKNERLWFSSKVKIF